VRRSLKYVVAISAVIVLAPIAALIGYDALYFQPSLAKTNELIEPTLAVETQMPDSVPRLLDAAYGDRLKFITAKVLLLDSGLSSGDPTTTFVWGGFVNLHLSHEEQIKVIASRAYLGSGNYGFAAASRVIFNKPLSSLTPRESATLVTLLYSPSYYESHPEQLEKRRSLLLTKASYGP
jgi:hypothetical protein